MTDEDAVRDIAVAVPKAGLRLRGTAACFWRGGCAEPIVRRSAARFGEGWTSAARKGQTNIGEIEREGTMDKWRGTNREEARRGLCRARRADADQSAFGRARAYYAVLLGRAPLGPLSKNQRVLKWE